MELVECRTHDQILIGDRIGLIVTERRCDAVMVALTLAADCSLRFEHGDLRREPLEAGRIRYLLPLFNNESFQVDDIRIGIGLYLDRREIADNDGCDIQLQLKSPQPLTILHHRATAPAPARIEPLPDVFL